MVKIIFTHGIFYQVNQLFLRFSLHFFTWILFCTDFTYFMFLLFSRGDQSAIIVLSFCRFHNPIVYFHHLPPIRFYFDYSLVFQSWPITFCSPPIINLSMAVSFHSVCSSSNLLLRIIIVICMIVDCRFAFNNYTPTLYN